MTRDFEEYLAIAWPRLLRSAWLLTGDWHRAEDLVQAALARVVVVAGRRQVDHLDAYTRRTLLMIYEERCDRGLRTVFTSNKSIQELAEMQDDDRLASRIAGRADVLKINTNDQRLRRVK